MFKKRSILILIVMAAVLLVFPVQALALPAVDVKPAMDRAANYLLSFEKEQGKPLTPWSYVALAAAGQNIVGARAGQSCEKQLATARSTADYCLLVFTLLAAGDNQSDYLGQNLVQKIQAAQLSNGKFADNIDGSGEGDNGEQILVNAHVWAVLALHAAGAGIPEAAKARQWLTSQQHADGSFNWCVTVETADVDSTGMALMALGAYAPSQKTASMHTLKSYQTSLTLYISFLESIKGITQTSLNRKCFERPFVEEWLGWLAAIRGCSPETCNNRLVSLRVFLKYLGSRDIQFLYLFNDACSIDRRKCQKKKVEGLSRDAVKALMECPDTKTASGRRDLTFMVLLYSTAARLDEMLSLKARQLHLEQAKPSATTIGKGNKVRTLYLLPKAVAHLRKYMKEFHGTDPNPESYVFYSRNTGSTGKLTQPAIAKMLRKYALTAHEICPDVPLILHAHQFRHAKASHWLEDGMNIVQISFLLGQNEVFQKMIS